MSYYNIYVTLDKKTGKKSFVNIDTGEKWNE
jgi:hypothetical protein